MERGTNCEVQCPLNREESGPWWDLQLRRALQDSEVCWALLGTVPAFLSGGCFWTSVFSDELEVCLHHGGTGMSSRDVETGGSTDGDFCGAGMGPRV